MRGPGRAAAVLLIGWLAVALLTGCGMIRVPWPGHPTRGPTPDSASPLPADSPDRPTGKVPDVTPPGMVDAPAGDGLAGYLNQGLHWERCGDFECTKILVPLDYDHPADKAITLALKKRRATAKPRMGTLFVNPGGPGEPGRELAESFRHEGLEGYDILGWDPRGSGESTPVRCFQGKDVDAYTEIDSSPDDSAEEQALVVMNRSFGQSCLEHSGRLLQHISTVETVRDLDLMRQLVGDPALNYFGYSYGTMIGARYATMFPHLVGRMALDGAVNVTDDTSILQQQGFDRALHHFAEWCVQQKCSLGSTPEKVIEAVTQVFDRADVSPLETGDPDRKLTQSLAVIGVAVTLYGDVRTWSILKAALEDARKGEGGLLLQLADVYNGREDDGHFDDRMFAFPAISCLDEADRGLAGAEQDYRTAQEKAPVFGKYFGPEVQCPVWPVAPVAKPAPISAPDANPIIVIGTTGDPATPYEYATWMTKALGGPAVLVTLDGEGHGGYGDKSPCLNDLVVSYFVRDEVPAPGKTCPA